ncbi:MAG: WG repeat-containing protein [Chitinophagaceae bacterium]|nr:WG repeat-containing protein [Chitinophagaceae bacterium]
MTKKIKYLIILMILACQANAQNLFWFIENQQIGFKNAAGVTVIKPRFAMAGQFTNGIAYAGTGTNQIGARYGFINEKGNWVIQPQFDAADDFAEGRARVLKNGKWGYINTKGKMIINPQFSLCYDFTNGFAVASKDNKTWGLIDSTGKFIMEPTYNNITNVGKDRVLAVKKTIGSPWKLINIKNESVSEKEFSLVRDFTDGIAPARDKNDKWGFINVQGDWVIEPVYTNAASFSEGLAAVEINYANWGFIDKNNSLKIKPEFDRSALFENGAALVEKGDEYLYINKTGNIILRFNK